MLDELGQDIYLYFLLGIAAFIVLFVFRMFFSALYRARRRGKIRKNIYAGTFLYYKDFENRWIISSGRGRNGKQIGFKYQDGPGCYVITIYDHPVVNGNFQGYENIYIGQSVKVCQRVHDHLNGKGNGDVYADVKYGKWVYIRFVKCSKQDMNRVEKGLIAAFNSTNSYNNTKGGSIRR